MKKITESDRVFFMVCLPGFIGSHGVTIVSLRNIEYSTQDRETQYQTPQRIFYIIYGNVNYIYIYFISQVESLVCILQVEFIRKYLEREFIYVNSEGEFNEKMGSR
jgi:hypothetical protein